MVKVLHDDDYLLRVALKESEAKGKAEGKAEGAAKIQKIIERLRKDGTSEEYIREILK